MKRNSWKLKEYDECGGYDCMTGAIRIGHALLDGNAYGQKTCDDIAPEVLQEMEKDARLIAAAPAMLSALKVIVTWASVDGALLPDNVLKLCNNVLDKVQQ